jgi:anti-sigma regulatory factor (Ser/Thr protein kinase)
MLQIRHRFPAHAAAAAAARRAVEGLLAGSSPGQLDDARIVVSELVTYSIVNAQHDQTAWIDLTFKVSRSALRIEVNRNQSAPPDETETAVPKDDALSDHSRFIVERLADEWGTSPGDEVWAVLPRDRGEDTHSRLFEPRRSLSLRS